MIDNRTLKESLIIADNKEGERVEFTRKNQKDIQNLLKHNRDIKIIKGIEKEFSEFKDLVDEYHARRFRLAEIGTAFTHKYLEESQQLESSNQGRSTRKTDLSEELKTELEPGRNKLNQDIGGLVKDIDQNLKNQKALDQSIAKIKSYPSLEFLEENKNNLDRGRREIESRLTQIESHNKSSLEIESKITELQSEVNKLGHQINSYSNLMIHRICEYPDHKEILNTILSDDITALAADAIITPVSEVSDRMKIFNGLLQLPPNLIRKPVASIQELEKKKTRLELEKLEHENLLPVARDREEYQTRLEKIQREMEVLTDQIEDIRTLPEREIKREYLREEGVHLVKEKEQTEQILELTESKIDEIKESIDRLTDEINTTENRLDKIRDWKLRIERIPLQPVEFSGDESLDNLYVNFENNLSKIEEIKARKDRLFDQLKSRVESVQSSEEEFITYIQSELATLDDKRRSIDGLLKSIATQFSNPCNTLYTKFQEFESFINNRFNSKIRKIRISDIDSLRIEVVLNEFLIDNLKKIMAIRDLTSELVFDDQTTNLDILNKYLDQQEMIEFEDLFDIKLHLEKNEQHKEVNLKNQIESDGTDKMIRLVIIMAIISQIAINDVENQIVILLTRSEPSMKPIGWKFSGFVGKTILFQFQLHPFILMMVSINTICFGGVRGKSSSGRITVL